MAADLEAHVIVVPDDSRAVVAALRPVAAGRVAARRRIHALWIGTGQHIVRVHRVRPTGDNLAFLGQGGLLVEICVRRMEVVHVFGDDDAFDVLPLALSDPVARVDATIATAVLAKALIAPLTAIGALLGMPNTPAPAGGRQRALLRHRRSANRTRHEAAPLRQHFPAARR